MDEELLTPWFDGAVKPDRPGVYMQMNGLHDLVGYQYWNGRLWGAWCETVESAYQVRRYSAAHSSYQSDPWRGLLKTPNV